MSTWFEPVQLEFPFPASVAAPSPTLNERLLSVHLAGLDSESWRVRRKAARGLATLGTMAAEAIPALKRIAESDADGRVKEAAAEAVRRTGGETETTPDSRGESPKPPSLPPS